MSTELSGLDTFIPKSQAETFARHLQNRLRSLSTGSEGDGIEDTSWNGDQLSSSSENDIYYDVDSCPGSPAEDALESDFSNYINLKHNEEESSIYPQNDIEPQNNHNNDNNTDCHCYSPSKYTSRNKQTSPHHCPDLVQEDNLRLDGASSLQPQYKTQNNSSNHCHCLLNGSKESTQYLPHETLYLHFNKVSSIDKFTANKYNDSLMTRFDDNGLTLNTADITKNIACASSNSVENSLPIDIERKTNGFSSIPTHENYMPNFHSSPDKLLFSEENLRTSPNRFHYYNGTSLPSVDSILHHNSLDSSQGSFLELVPLINNQNRTADNDRDQDSSRVSPVNELNGNELDKASSNDSFSENVKDFSPSCVKCKENSPERTSKTDTNNSGNDSQPYPDKALLRLADTVFNKLKSPSASFEEDDGDEENSFKENECVNGTEEQEESIETRRSRFRRCSSLKTGKTPPSTPGRKKIVRFADVLGLDLADVRTFMDEVPKIPKSAFEDLHGVELSSSPICSSISDFVSQAPAVNRVMKIVVPMFRQPSSRPDFMDRVKGYFVCLENAVVSDMALFAITGVVRVKNIDYHKSVHIRYSIDSWRSFADLQAKYVPNSSDGLTDKFSFLLYAHMLNIGQKIEFAVRFQVRDSQYWDSNNGSNYVFQCIPDRPDKPDPSLYVPPSPIETWASFY